MGEEIEYPSCFSDFESDDSGCAKCNFRDECKTETMILKPNISQSLKDSVDKNRIQSKAEKTKINKAFIETEVSVSSKPYSCFGEYDEGDEGCMECEQSEQCKSGLEKEEFLSVIKNRELEHKKKAYIDKSQESTIEHTESPRVATETRSDKCPKCGKSNITKKTTNIETERMKYVDKGGSLIGGTLGLAIGIFLIFAGLILGDMYFLALGAFATIIWGIPKISMYKEAQELYTYKCGSCGSSWQLWDDGREVEVEDWIDWLNTLKYKESEAYFTLIKMNDEKAIEIFIQALENEDKRMSGIGLAGLREIVDSKAVKAVEPLIQSLEDEDSFVIRWAAEALGKIGDTRAIEPLNQILEDDDEKVRKAAKKAMKKIKKRQK